MKRIPHRQKWQLCLRSLIQPNSLWFQQAVISTVHLLIPGFSLIGLLNLSGSGNCFQKCSSREDIRVLPLHTRISSRVFEIQRYLLLEGDSGNSFQPMKDSATWEDNTSISSTWEDNSSISTKGKDNSSIFTTWDIQVCSEKIIRVFTELRANF